MNSAASIGSYLRRRGRGFRVAAPGRLRRAFQVVGILLLIVSLQSLAFHRHVEKYDRASRQNLELLSQETASGRLIDTALSELREYWRLGTEPAMKSLALELREDVVLRFRAEPLAVVERFQRGATTLQADSEASREALVRLNATLRRLTEVYTNRAATAWSAWSQPPLYLQPAAALVKLFAGRTEMRLNYNRALYLMLVGEREEAQEIFLAVRRAAESPEERALVLFAQARLRFDAFEDTKDPQQLSEALQHVRQSVRSDPDYELSKLFLDYLLSSEMAATEVDAEPLEGEGSGEGKGERGAISSRAPEF